MSDFTTITELNYIHHSYLPVDKSAQDAGKQVEVSAYTQHIINNFNNLIKEMVKKPAWIENRAHSQGEFKVICGEYQVSASVCYITKREPRVFTLKLVLDRENAYTPIKLIIDIRNPALPPTIENFEYNVGIENLEILTPSDAANKIFNLVLDMIKTLDAKIANKTGLKFNKNDKREMDIASYNFDLDFIKKRFMPYPHNELSAVKIAGWSLDTQLPLLYVSYQTDKGDGIHEIMLDKYLSSRFAH